MGYSLWQFMCEGLCLVALGMCATVFSVTCQELIFFSDIKLNIVFSSTGCIWYSI